MIDITRSPGTRKGNITLSNKRTKRKCIVSRSGKKCLGMKMEIEKNIRENIEKRYRKIEKYKKRERKKNRESNGEREREREREREGEREERHRGVIAFGNNGS